jgi:hypothetical protein
MDVLLSMAARVIFADDQILTIWRDLPSEFGLRIKLRFYVQKCVLSILTDYTNTRPFGR